MVQISDAHTESFEPTKWIDFSALIWSLQTGFGCLNNAIMNVQVWIDSLVENKIHSISYLHIYAWMALIYI